MKKYFLLLMLIAANLLVAQKQAPIDTAQVITPYWVNAPQTSENLMSY